VFNDKKSNHEQFFQNDYRWLGSQKVRRGLPFHHYHIRTDIQFAGQMQQQVESSSTTNPSFQGRLGMQVRKSSFFYHK
jgi:hypothetical protein